MRVVSQESFDWQPKHIYFKMRLAITLELFLIVFGSQEGIASYKLEVELIEGPDPYEGHLPTGGQGRYPRKRSRG